MGCFCHSWKEQQLRTCSTNDYVVRYTGGGRMERLRDTNVGHEIIVLSYE